MSDIGRNTRERHDGIDEVHLQNDYGRTAGYHTLCGICDMPSWLEETDDPVTCRTCMAVFEHCMRIAYVRGVIRSRPRASTIERARISVDADDEAES